MMTDSQLINELQNLLDITIKKKLKTDGEAVCKKELTYIRSALKQFITVLAAQKDQRLFSKQDKESSVRDLMKTLKSVAKRIDAEGKSLETEMHGVQYFSADLRKRLDDFAQKKILRDSLGMMLKKIRKEGLDVKESNQVTWYYSYPRG